MTCRRCACWPPGRWATEPRCGLWQWHSGHWRSWVRGQGPGGRVFLPAPGCWLIAGAQSVAVDDSATTPSSSARVCLLRKCGVCRRASFRVCVPVCVFLCASCVCTHLCVHIGVQRCLSVPLVSLSLHPHVHIVCAFVCKCAFVGRGVRLPQSLPFAPFSPRV